MINNVRISARQKKSELENTNIEIYPQQFDTSFIATYKDTSNNIPTENFLSLLFFALDDSSEKN